DSERRLRISHRVVVGTVAALVVAFSMTAGLVSREQVAAQVNPPPSRTRPGGVPQDAAERSARALNGIDGGATAVGIPGMDAKNIDQALRSAPEYNIQFKNMD